MKEYFLSRLSEETRRFIIMTSNAYATDASTNNEANFLSSMIKALYNFDKEKYDNLFGKFGYVLYDESITFNDECSEYCYIKIKELVEDEQDEMSIISPELIFCKYILKMTNESCEKFFYKRGITSKAYNDFLYSLKEETNRIIEIQTNNLEMEYKRFMPDATYKYLEEAAKIFSKLEKELDWNENEKKTIALFLALISPTNDLGNIRKVFESEFERRNLNYERVMSRILKVSPTIEKINAPITILNKYFKEYSGKNISVSKMFRNIFCDNRYNREILYNRILNYYYDKGLAVFDDLLEALERNHDNQSTETIKTATPQIRTSKYIPVASYSIIMRNYIDEKTREYIELCAKYYRALKNGNNRYGFLKEEQDYIEMAGILALWFKDNDKMKITVDDSINLKSLCGIGISIMVEDDVNISNELEKYYSLIFEKYGNRKVSLAEVQTIFEPYYRKLEGNGILGKTTDEFKRNHPSVTRIRNVEPSAPTFDTPAAQPTFDIIESVDIEVYNFLTIISNIYEAINTVSDEYRDVVALLLGIYKLDEYKNGIILEFFKKQGLDYRKVIQYFRLDYANLNIQQMSSDSKVTNRNLNHFMKYINAKNTTVENIISSILESNDFNNVRQVFDGLRIYRECITNFEKELARFEKEKEQGYLQYLKANGYLSMLLTYAYAIMNDIEKNKESINYINSKKNIESLSILIAFLMVENNDYYDKKLQVIDILEDAGLCRKYVFEKINYNPNLSGLKEIDIMEVIGKFKNVIEKIRTHLKENNKPKDESFALIMYSFDQSEELFKKIIDDENIFKTLKQCIRLNERNKISLPIERVLKLMQTIENMRPEVDYQSKKAMSAFATDPNTQLRRIRDYIDDSLQKIYIQYNLNNKFERLERIKRGLYNSNNFSLVRLFKRNNYIDLDVNQMKNIILDIKKIIDEIIKSNKEKSDELEKILKIIKLYSKEIEYYYAVSIEIQNISQLQKMDNLENQIEPKRNELGNTSVRLEKEKCDLEEYKNKCNELNHELLAFIGELECQESAIMQTNQVYKNNIESILEILDNIININEQVITKRKGR